MRSAWLAGADLKHAQLDGADFTRAVLWGADLAETAVDDVVDLDVADTTGVRWEMPEWVYRSDAEFYYKHDTGPQARDGDNSNFLPIERVVEEEEEEQA